MLITILASGSRGDIQPYIALGLALKKAGQQVRIASFENYADFVKSYGLDFHPVHGDVSRVMGSDEAQGAMKADNPLKVLFSFNKLKSLIFDVQKDFFDACSGSDAIVYHPGVPVGYFAAQQFKIPAIFAPPFPMTPTRAFPALIFYDAPRMGRAFNFATHKMFEQIMWMASSAPVKGFLRKEFGRVPRDFACPFGRQVTRRQPTVISCSNFVFPKPSDWPEHVHNTGYWFLDEDAGWTPPQYLRTFLERGPAPVYVGFGSVGDPTLAEATTRLVIAALQRSGQRGVLATGWNGMAKMDDLPDDIFMLESAPHSWLFPRMAAVVHHGGAGTTAAGVRAGVPTVIIPNGNDQFAWGRRVYELGVGAKPVPRKSLTAEKLSDAIHFAFTENIKVAAKELGRKIQSENGAEAAARVILDCFGN